MSEEFKDLRIVDNFYQSSSFFPMPTILIGSLCPDGSTNLGSYSLCFPYYVAGKDYYAMVLCARNSSNTSENILRSGKCSLNFIPDKKKYFKEAVRLGFPGETSKEKMKNCIFTLKDGLMAKEHKEDKFPKVVEEAFQVFECTWMKELDGAQNDEVKEDYSPPYHNFNGITSKFGAHFILRIDKILMKEKYTNSIINGAKALTFPSVPVDYGYRDSTKFWWTKSKLPCSEDIPKTKGVDVSVVMYTADRIDNEVKFTEEACEKMVKIPRVFLKTVLLACVAWAKENNVTLITKEHMDIINDKRAKEKRR